MDSALEHQTQLVHVPAHRSLNPQLEWITRLLTDHAIPYWLDSGTLLGVVRDGDVMAHDKDIDLAIWAKHVDQVDALTDKFAQAGYRVKSGVFEGLVYNFILEPKNGDGITISIGVNRRQGDKVWRMATYVKDNPYPRWGVRFFMRGLWRFPIRQLIRVLTLKIPRARLVDTWPFSTVLGSGVWIFPVEYVAQTMTHAPTGLPIPAKWNAYLTYRYGNWKEPVRDWAWYRDDAAAHIGHPMKIVDRTTMTP